MAFQTVKALQRGGERSQRGNPNGPAQVVAVFEPGARRPSLRKSLACSELKITRTCSLSSTPSPHSRTGVVLKNNVFSDLTAQTSLGTISQKQRRKTKLGDEDTMINQEVGKNVVRKQGMTTNSHENLLPRKLSNLSPCRIQNAP